jgi:hypothetical protein
MTLITGCQVALSMPVATKVMFIKIIAYLGAVIDLNL